MSITYPLKEQNHFWKQLVCKKITAVSSIRGLAFYCFTGGRGSRTMLRWMVAKLCEYVAGCQQETPPSKLRQ